MSRTVTAFRESIAAAKSAVTASGERVTRTELTKALAHLTQDKKVDAFELKAAKATLAKLPMTEGAKQVAAEFFATASLKDKPGSLASQLPPDWRLALADEVEKPYFQKLERFLADERMRHSVLPSPEDVFAALHRTPLAKVKVVLLGQDPYPTKGNANGLSFSIPADQPIPGSLRNMFKVMHEDVGAPIPTSGDLGGWADQGVLLLNTVLTVREGQPNSHKAEGWETFTRAIIDLVNKKDDPVAFLLLGKQAQETAALVDTSRHAIVNAPHPSPMAPGNPFAKTRPFSAVNEALREAGREKIRWG